MHRDIKRNRKPPTLEQFISEDDLVQYGHTSTQEATSSIIGAHLQLPSGPLTLPPARKEPYVGESASPRISVHELDLNEFTPLVRLVPLAHLNLICNFSTLESLGQHLTKINLNNPDRLRPQWDDYFMLLTELASLRSNCMKRRVGAVLVVNRRVVSTGYNGTPRGMKNCTEGGCPRCNGGIVGGSSLDTCLCLHAEENALLEAGRERAAAGGEGSVLYCNT